MSRKRWITAAAIAGPIAMMLVYHIFLAGPEPATAQSGPGRAAGKAEYKPPHAPAAAKPSVPDAAFPASSGSTRLAAPAAAPDPSLTYLDRIAEARAARDMFAPSPGMVAHLHTLERQAEAREKGPKPGSPELFPVEHHLQGTYNSPDGALAMVDGRPLRVGDQLAGWRLTRITPGQAEFRRSRHQVVLTIPPPVTSQPSQP